MAKSPADLLAMKAELTNDPTGIGLTVLEADDAANSAAINLVRSTVQIDRQSIPASEIIKAIDLDEFVAASQQHREYIQLLASLSSIDPSAGNEVREGLLQVFGAATETRASLVALLTRDGSRWEKMFADGLLEAEGDWTPSDIAQARQAT